MIENTQETQGNRMVWVFYERKRQEAQGNRMVWAFSCELFRFEASAYKPGLRLISQAWGL